jgi:glycerol kinase
VSAAACRSIRTSRRESSRGYSSTTTGVGGALDAGTLRLGRWTRSCATGFTTGSSTASRTQLGAPEWDPALLDIFGVRVDALPAIMDTAGDLGTLRHDSWPVELPLRARFVEQQAALAGAGCVEPGRVKDTYGTGVFVLAHAADRRPAA